MMIIPTQMIQNNNSYKQQLIYKNKDGGALREGGSLFLKKNNCDLCGRYFSVLTIVDFSRCGWIQGKKFELIKNNPDVKRFELNLCNDCRSIIFDKSIPTIIFSLKLFEVLKNGDS